MNPKMHDKGLEIRKAALGEAQIANIFAEAHAANISAEPHKG